MATFLVVLLDDILYKAWEKGRLSFTLCEELHRLLPLPLHLALTDAAVSCDPTLVSHQTGLD